MTDVIDLTGRKSGGPSKLKPKENDLKCTVTNISDKVDPSSRAWTPAELLEHALQTTKDAESTGSPPEGVMVLFIGEDKPLDFRTLTAGMSYKDVLYVLTMAMNDMTTRAWFDVFGDEDDDEDEDEDDDGPRP